MKFSARLLGRWETIVNSYWFVPTVIAAAAMALSVGTLLIDRTTAGANLGDLWWVYTGSAAGARSVLSTIATSVIGIAGVLFSITIVALTLVSNQFGSRLLRNFMRDRGNQLVLGTFIGTFLYCMVILRQLHGAEEGGYDRFVPQISMLTANILALLSMGMLIYFIHHVAASIQAPNIILAVAQDLIESIERLYPQEIGQDPEQVQRADEELRKEIPPKFEQDARPIRAGRSGYLQNVSPEQLIEFAADRELLVRVERRPGEFVVPDDPIFLVWPPDRLDDDDVSELRDQFAIGTQRTPVQDVKFPLEQILEVAALALSPGINKPFNAIMCIERLSEGFSALGRREIPSAYRVDSAGRLRVIAPPVEPIELFDIAFDLIRHHGSRTPEVLVSLLAEMERIAGHAQRPADRERLVAHAGMIREDAIRAVSQEHDRAKVERAYAGVVDAAARRGERSKT